METGLQIFEKEEFGQVRAILHDGEPWFAAKGICDALGLENVTNAVDYLDQDEKLPALAFGKGLNETKGLRKDSVFISESGFYTLILRSNKPEAKRFQKWITSEVLPSIRKTGGYNSPKTLPEALRAYALELEQNERLSQTVVQQSVAIEGYQMRLGEHEEFHKVSEDPWIKDTFNPRAFGRIGIIVSAISKKMGLPIKATPHPVAGSVAVYSQDALSAFRIMCEADDSILANWRL